MRSSMNVDFAAEFLVEDHLVIVIGFSGLLIGAEDEGQVEIENDLQFSLAGLLTRSHQSWCDFGLLSETHPTWNLLILSG